MRGLRTPILLLAAAMLVGAPGPARAGIYRWVDAGGGVHFTSDLDEVPAAQRDAAREAAERRPTVNRADPRPAPAAPRAAPPPCPPGAACAGSRAPGPAAAEAERPGGRDEAGWRAEHTRLLGDVARLERQIELLEAKGAENAPDPWRQGMSHRDWSRYQDRHDAWQKAQGDLAAARVALERFEERARRSGVPPGWLR